MITELEPIIEEAKMSFTSDPLPKKEPKFIRTVLLTLALLACGGLLAFCYLKYPAFLKARQDKKVNETVSIVQQMLLVKQKDGTVVTIFNQMMRSDMILDENIKKLDARIKLLENTTSTK